MINMITRQAEALSPDYCAVAFDLKAPTFRHKMYDAYKAGRHATPDELLAQFPVAKEVLFPFILSQEGNVKLLEPADLKAEFKSMLQKMAADY